jgi:hypothetical protein
MQTLIILVSMFAAQSVEFRQEGKREGNHVQGEKVVMREASGGGTLLDLVDGLGGGWAYAEGGAGSSKEVLVPSSGGGMSMKAAPRGGTTLLDLIDR